MKNGRIWRLVRYNLHALYYLVEVQWADVTGFWESREHAREGGKGPWHKKAREAAGELYESIVFETWRLVIEDDVESWKFEKYEEVARGG